MAINLKSTKDLHTNGVKMLAYGQAGAGKTRLCATLPSPVVLSAESGLLTLADHDVAYVEIQTMADLADAYQWLTESPEAAHFESVALDSISEIAEVCLAHEKANTKDPRQAYGAMQDQVAQLVRSFRDLPGKHVYMSAKVDKSQDEMGRMLYAPSMPGNKAAQGLPYFFDEVFALRIEDVDGETQRMIQTQPDPSWSAKDRSGQLNQWEAPDLGAIIRKIGGTS